MKRFAFTVRPTRESREPRAPWDLVRLLLGAFGWTLESMEEVADPVVEPPPDVRTAEQIEAERRAHLTATLASIAEEVAFLRQGIDSFELISVSVRASFADPAAVAPLDLVPVSVFGTGRCLSDDGRHAFARVEGADSTDLRCARCSRVASVAVRKEQAN